MKNICLGLYLLIYVPLSVVYLPTVLQKIVIIDFLPKEITGTLVYQLVTLFLTLCFLILSFYFKRNVFKQYFRLGEINSKVEPEKFIMLKPKEKETWKQVGTNFAIIISLVTFIIMLVSINSDKAINLTNFIQFLPLIVIFSLNNAFVEEMMYRFGVVVIFKDLVKTKYIPLISGLIFGISHYFGMPGGIIGVLVAGFLGWFLAKSVVETKGMFWALLIHFLQDFIIFSFVISYL